jgi:hypothetical protein
MTKIRRQELKNTLIDRGLNKMISRKLLVWAFATAGVPLGFITGEQWVQMSMVYLGSQAAMDFILQYTRVKSGTGNVQ